MRNNIDEDTYIPPGVYDMLLVRHRTLNSFGGRVALEFEIQGSEYRGCIVRAYYPVKLKGPAKTRGKFYPPTKQTDLFRDYCALFGEPTRRDRLLEAFRGTTVKGRVNTVRTDRNRKPLPDACQYSVVTDFAGLAEEESPEDAAVDDDLEELDDIPF